MPATAERTESLKEVADREAAEAEAEAEQEDVQLETTSEPGEQGIATQEDEEVEAYVPPEPTEAEVKAAREVLRQLSDRVREYGPERTVEALLQIVDVLPEFRLPEEWPADEDEEYADAPVVQRIGTFLLKGCRPKLSLSPRDMVWLFRGKEKWTKAGTTVRGQSKGL